MRGGGGGGAGEGGVSAACACLTQQTRAVADPGAPLVSCSVSLTQELRCTCQGALQPCSPAARQAVWLHLFNPTRPPPSPSLFHAARFASSSSPGDGVRCVTANQRLRHGGPTGSDANSESHYNDAGANRNVWFTVSQHGYYEKKCPTTTTTTRTTAKAQWPVREAPPPSAIRAAGQG